MAPSIILVWSQSDLSASKSLVISFTFQELLIADDSDSTLISLGNSTCWNFASFALVPRKSIRWQTIDEPATAVFIQMDEEISDRFRLA